METTILQNEKDRILWKQAKKKVSFKKHLFSYLLVNSFLWAMWALEGRETEEYGLPWPTFCTLGWGFGLAWSFIGAFIFDNKISQVEKEYQKLKEKSSV